MTKWQLARFPPPAGFRIMTFADTLLKGSLYSYQIPDTGRWARVKESPNEWRPGPNSEPWRVAIPITGPVDFTGVDEGGVV